MAIILNTPPDHGYEIAALCGVNKVLLEGCKKAGVSVTYGANGTIKVEVDGTAFGMIPFKGSAYTLLKEGKMGPASKESAKYQLEKSLQSALASVPTVYGDSQDLHGVTVGHDDVLLVSGGYAKGGISYGESKVESVVKSMSAAQKAAATKAAAKAKALDDVDTLVSTGVFSPFASKPSKSKNQVKLIDATEMLQPVFGTSNGSVYYSVAFFTDLKVAMRRSGQTVSFRAEGNVAKHLKALQSLGFSDKGGYASAHLEVKDNELLHKTFGALIGAVGFGSLLQAANELEMA